MDAISTVESSCQRTPLPRLPPELLLEVFSYLDRSTLSALHLSDLSFYELLASSFYNTAHFDDLVHLTLCLCSRGLGGRAPRLAFDSVQTLHLTLPETPPSRNVPRIHLPKLKHLYIHYLEDDNCDPVKLPLRGYVDFLSHLNPLSITVSSCGMDSKHWNDSRTVDPPTVSWTSNWTRLQSVVFFGGSLFEISRTPIGSVVINEPVPAFVQLAGERSNGSKPFRVTYDLRTVDSEFNYQGGWPDYLFERESATYDFTILILTSSEKEQRDLKGEVDLAKFDRMEIRLESKADAIKTMEEMLLWREGGMGVWDDDGLWSQ